MTIYWQFWIVVMILICLGTAQRICEAQSVASLPEGVKAVWDSSRLKLNFLDNGGAMWYILARKYERSPSER